MAISKSNQKILDRINQLQRQILFYSFAYYKYDISVISDGEYDKKGRELMELQKSHSKITKMSAYYEAFKGFEGTPSGYDLPYDNDEINLIAKMLVYYLE